MGKTGFTRRGFLQRGAGLAGASLAAKYIVLDPEPLTALARMNAASDRVRFGIVGVGMEGTGLLTTAIQLPGVECVAVNRMLIAFNCASTVQECNDFNLFEISLSEKQIPRFVGNVSS